MKNILLLIFCLVTISAFAQKNELITSYQLNDDKNLGTGISFGYFRAVANNKAMGLKLLYTEKRHEYGSDKLTAVGLDATHRWNLSKREKVRFMIETGIAALKTYNESVRNGFECDCILVPNALIAIPDPDPEQYVYLGFTAGVMIDFQIFKFMNIGLGFSHNDYLTNHKPIDKGVSRSSLHLNIGVKF